MQSDFESGLWICRNEAVPRCCNHLAMPIWRNTSRAASSIYCRTGYTSAGNPIIPNHAECRSDCT